MKTLALHRATRRLVAAFALALLAAAPACALDFDRFGPGDGGAASGKDAATLPAEGDSAPDVSSGADDATDPATVDATDEVSDDAIAIDDATGTPDAAPAEAGPCTPSDTCLTAATTCASSCGQDHLQCTGKCSSNTCRTSCNRTENTCLTQCSSTCSSCTKAAGCSAATACANASKAP